MSTPHTPPTPKTRYRVIVKSQDGATRIVEIEATSKVQLRREAEPHFTKRGETIIGVEDTHTEPDLPPPPTVQPVPSASDGSSLTTGPIISNQIVHLINEQRKTNELLEALRSDLAGKMATRKGITVDIIAASFFISLVVLVLSIMGSA